MRLLLQIVTEDGTVVRFPAGGNPPRAGTLEADLIDTCTERVVKRGVGVFKTEAHVTQAIREGLIEAIQDLKTQTKYVILHL